MNTSVQTNLRRGSKEAAPDADLGSARVGRGAFSGNGRTAAPADFAAAGNRRTERLSARRACGNDAANVSKHLKILQDAGLLKRRPQGNSAYYSIADAMVFELCEMICSRLHDRLEAQVGALKARREVDSHDRTAQESTSTTAATPLAPRSLARRVRFGEFSEPGAPPRISDRRVRIVAAVRLARDPLMAGIALALTVATVSANHGARDHTAAAISVIGLGAGMNLVEVGRAGAHGFFYTVIGITLTMSVGLTMGWLLRTERDTSLLVTVGTAICGGSAIAAVAPAIHAKHHDVSVALATVFFLNAVALFIFPPLGRHFGLGQVQFGCGARSRFTIRVRWLERRCNMALARWRSPRLSS